MAKEKLSPMMSHYIDTKEQYQDCILFYRLGDFYEMFYEDAKTASRELELTLTGKSCGLKEKAPMCGVPFHAADTYIARLVEKGYKVAVCEQVEDPRTASGIVKREVVKIVTPGTVTGAGMLKDNENNYLASVWFSDEVNGLCYCDVSTGELYGCESTDRNKITEELVKAAPREILTNMEISTDDDVHIEIIPEDGYALEKAENAVLSHFDLISVKGLGIEGKEGICRSLGVLLTYIKETQKQSLKQINRLDTYELGSAMSLDRWTLRNLEITETLFDRTVKGSLLGVLDRTHTAMGGRLMKRVLREPLTDVYAIRKRSDFVGILVDEPMVRNNIKESLRDVYDFHRLTGRIASGTANARDLIALRDSLAVLPDLRDSLEDLRRYDDGMNEEILAHISEHKDLYALISEAICDDPPYTIKEGGLIKDEYSDELKDLKDSIRDAKRWISTLDVTERERTGIKNLKVGFNKVFGYYIEVTRSNSDMVPSDYIRKQTLVNAERYITPELKETENLVLNAEAKINELEYRIFNDIREEITGHIRELRETGEAIGLLDVMTSFAHVSDMNGYTKPEVDDGDVIEIIKGRHPVIELNMGDEVYVSNDLYMDRHDSSMLLITGPNMSGKSTYMRQCALIVLMAQTGCFVPCERLKLGIVDRIFTRIGASDNLSKGQSTFFVEMSELAHILNSATGRSLILLDEIGRGTSTYDGLSIAWATVEYLCSERTRIRTLFATHYHELTALEGEVGGVKNLNVAVTEDGGNIVFLHKIVPGATSRSYGIHVSKIAGIPASLLERAGEKLYELETGRVKYEPAADERQMSLFSTEQSPITDKIRAVDIMNTTPSQALKIIEELKEEIDK